jgi:hypothetical protein
MWIAANCHRGSHTHGQAGSISLTFPQWTVLFNFCLCVIKRPDIQYVVKLSSCLTMSANINIAPGPLCHQHLSNQGTLCTEHISMTLTMTPFSKYSHCRLEHEENWNLQLTWRNLTQVCQRWRYFMFDSSSTWISVFLSPRFPSNQQTKPFTTHTLDHRLLR